MKKRILAMLLAGSMLVFSAVSCGDDQGSSSQSSGSSTASGSTESNDAEEEIVTEITLPITEEKVTFTEWRSWSNNWLTNYGEVRGIQEVERLTNVRVEYTCVPGSAALEKFGLLLASGEYPSMIQASDSIVYPGGLDAGIADGVLRDMTEYVRKYMPNYRSILENDEGIKRIAITDEGKNVGIYMIRCYVDGHNQEVVIQNEPAWCGMAVRKDWLDELNMEVPRTIDELYDVLVAFKDNYGAWMHLYKDGTIGNDYILSAYGVMQDFYMIDGGDTVGFGPTTEEYKTYLKLMRDWYAEGLIDPDFTSTSSTYILTDDEYFANNKCGVGVALQGTSGNYYYYSGYTSEEDFWLEPIEGPVLNEGDTTVSTYPSYTATVPQLICTSVSDEDMPVLAKFLDWHYTYDYAVIASFGVEGESYEIDENSEWYYVWTDTVMKPEGMTPFDARPLYGLFDNVGYMNWKAQFEINEATGNTWSAYSYEVWGRQTDDIMIPLGASFTADEATEYNNLYVDIQTYVEESTVQFIMGTLDIDSQWDNYVSTLEGMNVARCQELRQASVDRYYNKVWLLDQ